MAEYITVAQAADLKSGDRIVVEVAGHYVGVFNVGGNFYAIEDVCTHDDGPLADGDLYEFEIECPRHGGRFDIRTGEVRSMPAIIPVPRYDTRVVDGAVQVLI